MTLEDITKALREYVVERHAISSDDADFNDDVHLFDYGYVDSFGAAELVSFVQQAFGVEVSHADMIAYPMNTISEIATFVFLRRSGEL